MKIINKLSKEQKERYYRQIIIPEIGEKGQIKLLNSSVLVIGAGGLGSPQLLYLTAAGIGKIGIADFDTVGLSNLNRQILYRTEDVGKSKLKSAVDNLNKLNNDVQFIRYDVKIDKHNIKNIILNYDLILDATDNFHVRYIINEVCSKLKKPWIFGGIRHFYGQICVFDLRTDNSPCLNCIFPSDEKEDLIPTSEIDRGVIGFSPGIIGTIQVANAIKILLNIGNIKSGALITEDILNNTRKDIIFKKNPYCSVCGEESSK